MGAFVNTLIATFIVSLIAIIGIISLSLEKKFLKHCIIYLVAFASGALLAVAFFDLIPEIFEEMPKTGAFFIVGGLLLFFIIESFFHWHHHSEGSKKAKKPVGYLNLVGDGMHNFADGTVIAATFLTNPGLGVATTIAIALHEIPQELGDFGILVNSGFKVKRALFLNFLAALSVVLGGVVVFIFRNLLDPIIPGLLGIAGGGFIYIAISDLFPELHEASTTLKKTILNLIVVLLGVVVLYFVLGSV